MKDIYTMDDWERDGTLKVEVGQFIDDDIFYELRDCVPPQTLTSKIFQVGEAYDHDEEGRPTYTTFVYIDGMWMYAGHEISC